MRAESVDPMGSDVFGMGGTIAGLVKAPSRSAGFKSGAACAIPRSDLQPTGLNY